MDPKATPQPGAPAAPLDPKLQEAYDKVMNFSTNPQAGTTAAPTTATTPPTPMAPSHEVPPTTPPPSVANGMFSNTPEPLHTTAEMQHTSPTVVINNDVNTSHDTKETSHGVVAKKKGGPLLPLLFVIGAVIFIALYAIIWVKIFNIQVPFLPF